MAADQLEIYVMNRDGSDVRQVTKLGAASFAPFFTPDGTQIIFSSNVDDPKQRNFDLYLVNVDGTGLERVTYNDTFDGFPMFSPDGSKLVFASNRNDRDRRRHQRVHRGLAVTRVTGGAGLEPCPPDAEVLPAPSAYAIFRATARSPDDASVCAFPSGGASPLSRIRGDLPPRRLVAARGAAEENPVALVLQDGVVAVERAERFLEPREEPGDEPLGSDICSRHRGFREEHVVGGVGDHGPGLSLSAAPKRARRFDHADDRLVGRRTLIRRRDSPAGFKERASDELSMPEVPVLKGFKHLRSREAMNVAANVSCDSVGPGSLRIDAQLCEWRAVTSELDARLHGQSQRSCRMPRRTKPTLAGRSPSRRMKYGNHCRPNGT